MARFLIRQMCSQDTEPVFPNRTDHKIIITKPPGPVKFLSTGHESCCYKMYSQRGWNLDNLQGHLFYTKRKMPFHEKGWTAELLRNELCLFNKVTLNQTKCYIQTDIVTDWVVFWAVKDSGKTTGCHMSQKVRGPSCLIISILFIVVISSDTNFF